MEKGMNSRLDGFAVRVPTPNVSVVDLTFIAEMPMTVEFVDIAFLAASRLALKGSMGYLR